MRIIIFISVFLLAIPGTYIKAQSFNDPIPKYDSITLYSKNLKELRRINIWIPETYKNDSTSLPVLYMPDGGINEDFPHIANTVCSLIQSHKISPIILIGIENTQRRRDLTGPTTVESDKKIAPVVGGSFAFRTFLLDELIPEINKQYRTTTTKGIIGESLAGLFVTETFLLFPDSFDFYIAFDPSLWWNNQFLVKMSKDYLEKFPNQSKTFWFASSSAKDIRKPVKEFSNILQSKKINTLRCLYSPEPNEKHNTIFRSAKEKAIIWTLNNSGKN